jgi:signal transduction histidine kinase
MLERAQLFQGNVEARRVPGVGVTVNAIFPGIENFLAEKDN